MGKEPGHEEKLSIPDRPCTTHLHTSDWHLVALLGPQEDHYCLIGRISGAGRVLGDAATRELMCHRMNDVGSWIISHAGLCLSMSRGAIGWNAKLLEGQPPIGSQADSWIWEKDGQFSRLYIASFHLSVKNRVVGCGFPCWNASLIQVFLEFLWKKWCTADIVHVARHPHRINIWCRHLITID